MTNSLLVQQFSKLVNYCENESFKGYDPFDGLNSQIFTKWPILKRSELLQLAWIQFFKRSPLNFRKIAGIRKEYNPKGLGLFLSAYCNLYKMDPSIKNREKINFFIEEIHRCKSKH